MAPLPSPLADDDGQGGTADLGSRRDAGAGAAKPARDHVQRNPGESEEAARRRAEETEASLRHLDMNFMRGFTRFIFNPSNPFIAGGSVLAGVVGVQTAWLQATYEPLPHPKDARSVGYVSYDGPRGARRRARRLLVIGDSLVLGIGCDETPVLANSLARGLATHGQADVAWRSFGVDGGDTRTIAATLLADIERAVAGSAPAGPPGSDAASFAGAGGRVEIDVCVLLLGTAPLQPQPPPPPRTRGGRVGAARRA